MAKSDKTNKRVRKSDDIDIPDSWTKDIPISPRWWAPTFVTLMIIGLIWLVVYYFAGWNYPIPGLHYWNLAIGIAFLLGGFFMTLRWKE